MIVLLNIISPLITLVILLILFKWYQPSRLNILIGIVGFTLGISTIPLVMLNFHYYNWVLEYFKFPVLLISITLLMIFIISNKYIRLSIISLLSLAFILNLTYQFIVQMAQMGGSWKPTGCPDFAPPVLTNKNYNLIKGNGYFIHETKINGLVYKEVSHKGNLNSNCQTVFNLYDSDKSLVFDSCKNELVITK